MTELVEFSGVSRRYLTTSLTAVRGSEDIAECEYQPNNSKEGEGKPGGQGCPAIFSSAIGYATFDYRLISD